MAAIAVGLLSSLLWGLADFLGGLKSRTYPVAVVLAMMYLSSLVVMLAFVGARGEGPPAGDHVLAALGAGLVGIAGLASFYRARAIGTLSIVAPIAATGVALPVIVGRIGGDDPGPIGAAGLALAVVGVVMASREDDEGAADAGQQRLSVVLAIVAGLGFGSYFVLAEYASSADVGWALVLSRTSAFPLIAAIALVALRRRDATRPGPAALTALAAIGLLDLGANYCFNYASTIGELSSVAVTSSLYPVTTVMLAAVWLGERVQGVQRFGVVIALTGVVMIAAGG
jgi:drug/metabolite transporter (DMT)-like permease